MTKHRNTVVQDQASFLDILESEYILVVLYVWALFSTMNPISSSSTNPERQRTAPELIRSELCPRGFTLESVAQNGLNLNQEVCSQPQ